jgi:hypothetical protein
MTTFTIDAENNITAFPTPDHAEAAVGAGAPLAYRLQPPRPHTLAGDTVLASASSLSSNSNPAVRGL